MYIMVNGNEYINSKRFEKISYLDKNLKYFVLKRLII